MKTTKSRLALLLTGLVALFGLTNCGDPEESVDAGSVKTDAGTTQTDAGAQDAGQNPVDGGSNTEDAGVPLPPDTTTVVQINKKAFPQGNVVFTAVAVSPAMYISKSTNAANPADHYCLYGLFVADANASAENNGVMLLSKSTVTNGQCDENSQVHGSPGNPIQIGEELKVLGYYQERCTFWNTDTNSCNDKDQNGKDISMPQVSVNKPGDVVRTGNRPGVPTSLPASVTIDEVNASGTAAPYTLGSKWWTYRSVLVKVQNVKVVNANPAEASGGDFCEFEIAPTGQTTPTLRVDDALMFAGTKCPHRPALDTELTSLAGVIQFSYGASKLLPRGVDDATPPLPDNPVTPPEYTETTIAQINKKEVQQGNVKFTAVMVSPLTVLSKSTSSCLFGAFVAASGAAPENNGVMLVSKSTVTSTGACETDSQLHGIAVGEEIQVQGAYQERCGYWNSQTSSCNDKDTNGNAITLPQVSVNAVGDVTKTGNQPGVPAGLPAVVTVDEIASNGSPPSITLGSKWWTYRAVLVRVENVEVVDTNPDQAAGKDYCEWAVAPTGETSPRLRVDDALMDGGATCPHRPTMGAEYTSLDGLLYWYYSASKLLPRTSDDAAPALP